MWGQVGRRRGARTPACRVETSLGFAARSVPVVERGAASKGGCSQDWLPHVPPQIAEYSRECRRFERIARRRLPVETAERGDSSKDPPGRRSVLYGNKPGSPIAPARIM